MAYIIVGKKGKTVRYAGTKGSKKLRRLPIAVSTKEEAEHIKKSVLGKRSSKADFAWKVKIKKI